MDTTSKSDRTSWAWWRRISPLEINPRHGVRILSAGAGLEALVFENRPSTPLDRALGGYQRTHAKMGKNDRAVLAEALYNLGRNRETFRKALPDEVPGEGRFLVLALLDLLGRNAPGKVPHLPTGVKDWLSALERVATLRSRWSQTLVGAWDQPPHQVGPRIREAWSCLTSVPDWWLDLGSWTTLGAAVREVAALRRPQTLTLRTQPHRTTREAALAELEALEIPVRPTPRSPWGIRVRSRVNLRAQPIFKQGRVEVQDEGSQLVACLCDPKPGERVLDLCAGGGGKTLALASAMGGKGLVVATDPDRRRLADTRKRARRSGLGNVRVEPDAVRIEADGPYDLVVVDAPCSSTGTLRRNPDVAWRWSTDDVDRLAALQADILDRAAGLVAPGGHLVYVTCSVLRQENHAQAEGFAARHPAFEPAPPGDRRGHGPLEGIRDAETGAFRLAANLPDYTGDAFFVARFRRRTLRATGSAGHPRPPAPESGCV